MSIDELRQAADLGAYIEILGRNLAVEGDSKQRSLAAIRAVGPSHFFVASDSGLAGEINHTDALALGAKALRAAGFSENDLKVMFKDNPAYLVRLPPLEGPLPNLH
jgi:hypothetical protein